MVSVLYTANFIYHCELYSYENYEKGSKPDEIKIITGTIICPGIIFVLTYLQLPSLLTSYTMATSIEMMKDRELVEKTLCF